LIFAAEPENDFMSFIGTYFKECAQRSPKIEAIAGKWRFEDLIPGMSDFDSRFICSDSMTAEDWCEMSQQVGMVHLDLCKKYPQWIRILEHLPGINLTWKELTDDFSYYPEYQQWTFYDTKNTAQHENAQKVLDQHRWEDRDEYYHLKKFFLYYGPYDRNIDPAVNLGAFENKYPLHSRIMHYFDPPVQSAVSVILKKNVKGKKEAFRLAGEIFGDLSPLFKDLLDITDRHYQVQKLYAEPAVREFEKRLEDALDTIFDELKKHMTIVSDGIHKTAAVIKSELVSVKVSARLVIYDNCKFSRLMKGRLYFYANAPEYFDNVWTIRNELKRIGNNFYRVPYATFWKLLTGEEICDPDNIVKKLAPRFISEKEAEAALEFSRLAPGTWEPGKEVQTALKIVDVFDDFFKGLSKIMGFVTEETGG
jgi:hypothetical protein